jgi:rubrerythrin
MPLLSIEPSIRIDSLSDLIGVGLAMEEEAARRYRELAGLMEARGASGTAATFRMLALEEETHSAGIAEWGEGLIGRLPQPEPFVWQLPPEIARSWAEVASSGLLTPYRALAIAVHNEERAFAFYSYVAAHATDPEVRKAAEGLAAEELGHATLLRRHRRAAWRDQGGAAPRVRVASLADLEEQAGHLLALAAAHHRALADQIDASEPELAGLLADLAHEEEAGAKPPTAPIAAAWPGPRDLPEARQLAARPLEQLAELYEQALADATTEDVLDAAQAGLAATVGRLSRLASPVPAPDAR